MRKKRTHARVRFFKSLYFKKNYAMFELVLDYVLAPIMLFKWLVMERKIADHQHRMDIVAECVKGKDKSKLKYRLCVFVLAFLRDRYNKPTK